MELSEFVTFMQDELEKFEADYLTNQEIHPEYYPDELNFAEWFEQLDLFLNNQHEE